MAFPLYLDEDSMDRRVLRALIAAGVDCVSVVDADRRGMSDDDQLAHAVAESRALVSANQRDFARIHVEWLRAGRHHAGIVVINDRRIPPGLLIAKLLRLQAVYDGGAIQDQILFLNAQPLG